MTRRPPPGSDGGREPHHGQQLATTPHGPDPGRDGGCDPTVVQYLFRVYSVFWVIPSLSLVQYNFPFL